MKLFKEHPSVIMFLISILIFGITIGIGFLYQWHWLAIIAVVLGFLAMSVTFFTMLYDFHLSSKKVSAEDAKVFKAEDETVMKTKHEENDDDTDW